MTTSARHITILLIAINLIQTLPLSSPDGITAGNCVLNFTSYPNFPTGECMTSTSRHAKMKINVWGSWTTTPCCRNALTTFSESLALHANASQGNVFVSDDEWRSCDTAPFQSQDSVSATHCGLDKLYYGSSDCSRINFASIKQEDEYKNTLNICSQLTNASSSFDEICRNCTDSLIGLKKHLLDQYHKGADNKTESSICGVATVISIGAGTVNNSLLIDNAAYFSCLASLEQFEPGYLKLKYSLVEAVLSILMAICGVALIVLLIKYVTKKKPKRILTGSTGTTWSGLYRFSKEEIESAINYEPEKNHLGRGSAGHVYKGILPSGQVVAIKHINKSSISDSFTREVEGLSRVRHPNLVCLFGCCVEGGEQYLVYEYCSAGNLAQHLLRDEPVLSWEQRVKILRHSALALRYLHYYIDGCIVHRDIKLTNILLTENLDPKLSDFGLAKMLGMEESKVFTDVKGTIGYMDPEYMTNAKLTCASDIYSFGIVALQLLSGQKVFELDLDARDQLTRKAKDISMNKRPAEDLEDPRLKGNVNKVDFNSILQIAVLCVAKSSKGRPTIDQVFEEMDKAWKNTAAETKEHKSVSSSATPMSLSSGVLSV